MDFERSEHGEKTIVPSVAVVAMLCPSNQELRAFFPVLDKNAPSDPPVLDFRNPMKLYGKDNLITQVHRLDEQPLQEAFAHRPYNEPERGSESFVDTGKTMELNNPDSWTLPKPENYKGWMPGDPINPLTWDKDASLYVQEIMKQNFVVGPDGKRVSTFLLHDLNIDSKMRLDMRWQSVSLFSIKHSMANTPRIQCCCTSLKVGLWLECAGCWLTHGSRMIKK
jgi:hypothetical protein